MYRNMGYISSMEKEIVPKCSTPSSVTYITNFIFYTPIFTVTNIYFHTEFLKTILVSIAPLLFHLFMIILCGVCMYICLFKCACVHTHTCFVGLRLRSGIFLDHSFLSFFEARSPNQTKTLPTTLALLLSLFQVFYSACQVPGRPPCPPSVYISSGDLNAPTLTCLTAEQSTHSPLSPFKNISSLFGFSLSIFN